MQDFYKNKQKAEKNALKESQAEEKQYVKDLKAEYGESCKKDEVCEGTPPCPEIEQFDTDENCLLSKDEQKVMKDFYKNKQKAEKDALKESQAEEKQFVKDAKAEYGE